MADINDEHERKLSRLKRLSLQENFSEVKHSCGAIIDAGHIFCYECGAEIQEKTIEVRHSCGAILTAKHKFCYGCGEKIAEELNDNCDIETSSSCIELEKVASSSSTPRKKKTELKNMTPSSSKPRKKMTELKNMAPSSSTPRKKMTELENVARSSSTPRKKMTELENVAPSSSTPRKKMIELENMTPSSSKPRKKMTELKNMAPSSSTTRKKMTELENVESSSSTTGKNNTVNIKRVTHFCGATEKESQRGCHESENYLETNKDEQEKFLATIQELEKMVDLNSEEGIKQYERLLEDKSFRDKYELYISHKVNGWKKEKLKFGIVGRTAQGKSSFINTILGLQEDSPSAAKVGQGDVTLFPKEYSHPKHQSITIVDTPGFGTIEMKKETYLQLVDLQIFDYFFIFIDNVFHEDDVWLAKQLNKKWIPFGIIRNKVDMDIEKGEKKGESKEEVINRLRLELSISSAKEPSFKGVNIFLLSTKKPTVLLNDWTLLIRDIASRLKEGKLTCLMVFVPVFTKEDIEKKYQLLQKRIKWLSLLATVMRFFTRASKCSPDSSGPYPRCSKALFIQTIKDEIDSYSDSFHLNEGFGTALKNEIEDDAFIRRMHSEKSIKSFLSDELSKRYQIALSCYTIYNNP